MLLILYSLPNLFNKEKNFLSNNWGTFFDSNIVIKLEKIFLLFRLFKSMNKISSNIVVIKVSESICKLSESFIIPNK